MPDILSAVDFNAPQLDWNNALARYTRRRRQQLGLSQERAAELAGLELSEWYALECGWVPEMPQSMGLLRAIAGALQNSWAEYSFLALVSDCRPMDDWKQ